MLKKSKIANKRLRQRREQKSKFILNAIHTGTHWHSENGVVDANNIIDPGFNASYVLKTVRIHSYG